MQRPAEENHIAPDTQQVLTAAIYARVSSSGQLGRGGDTDGDGYSIPAQIKACERIAEQLGATVARAYVERAESARSDNRPVLQQMMHELPSLGVSFVIVHKVDRLARNRLDDATLYERLIGMKIKLVSATENIDETPAGRLMHGMLATFAEYYSNNLATEIKKGLHQKHQTGGTPFKPPIGYMPKRELMGNQDIRTVVIDPERAPLVREAFDLYATGNWSTRSLTRHLEQRGLRSRPTPKLPARPLQVASVHKMLKNPYYVGIVVYRGVRVPNGIHEPLIDRDTFDRVQALLAARAVAGDRPYKNHHYLRGSLYCAKCRRRLLYGRHRGKSGTIYEYFYCIGRRSRRQGGQCTSRHYPAHDIEREVLSEYRKLRLTEKVRNTIWADIRRDTAERTAIIARDIERNKRRVAGIQANQARLVQLAYKGIVDDEVLAAEQQRLEQEKAKAHEMQAAAEAQALDVETTLAEALERTKTPHETYAASEHLERRLLNQTFFTQILVDDDSKIVRTELTPLYAALRPWEPAFGQPAGSLESPNPGRFFGGRGSNYEPMVETVGIEPTSVIA
jgi:site-specific DNA recombinase